MKSKIWLITTFLIYGCLNVNSEERSVSTSVAGMIELLEIEEAMVKSLDDYADKLEKKLNTLRSALSEMHLELEKSKPDAEAYLSNPLNAFSLIRRMQGDWVNFEYYIQQPIDGEHIKDLESHHSKLPTSTDLVEAINAIRRLQTTYDMKHADMAAGRLNGRQYDAKLSAMDTYTVGYELFKQENYYEAAYWVYVALQTFVDSDVYTALGFNRQKIFELYAEIFIKQNRFKDAQDVLTNALAQNPTDAKLLRRKADIELELVTNSKPPIMFGLPRPSEYQLGCRGNFASRLNNLHCRYNTTTNDFLKLAPIKMEEISLNPYMILYHDVISDEEIIHLKEIGGSSLTRATVFNETAKRSVVVSTRTSKFSWLSDNATEVTKRLNQRIADMTGFEIRGSEMLQVMNYGLGGHYDTHHDFFNTSMEGSAFSMQGDRMSTVLFYMSNVEQGGATVFPHLKIGVYPQKGSAIMWYNLNNRGQGDWRTMHAACPVIVGSKWVCNKWIRERNQFRTRPCFKE